jgi:hypothetical protein
MPIQATGIVSLRLEDLRALLGACASWRSWTKAADVAAAKRHVHLVDIPPSTSGSGYTRDELTALRPLARVDEYEEDNRLVGGLVLDRTALGGFVLSGKLVLTFEDEVPEEDADDPAAAKLRFMNNIGAVLKELADLGGGEGEYLSIHRVEKFGKVARASETDVETMGDFLQAQYVIHHGP